MMINTSPYFLRITAADKEIKSLKYVVTADVYNFQTYKSKTVQSKTLEKICAGLNHMLLWAKSQPIDLLTEYTIAESTKEAEFKQMFLNKFSQFIHDLHEEITSPHFTNICARRIQDSERDAYGRLPTMSDIQSDILVGWVEQFMDDEILMTGVLKYAYQYTNWSSLEKNEKYKLENNLNKYDIFGIIVFIILSKIIYLAFSVYSSNAKANVIVVKPIYVMLSRLQDKISDFFTNVVQESPLEIQKIRENNYEENIISYIYSSIDKKLEVERNRSVFENVGITESESRNQALKTVLTSIFKILPVLDTEETQKDAIPFSHDEDWEKYSYVFNNVMKYINNTIKNVLDQTSKIRTNVISRTVSDEVSDNNITYKQEIFLEARNNTVLLRKKKLINLLNDWCMIERSSMGDYEREIDIYNATIVDTPLRAYILTSILNELNEDSTTIQLLDKTTLANILLVASYKLRELGYTRLSKALLAKGVTNSGAYNVDKQLEKLKESSIKYQQSPERLEKYFIDIASRAYIPQTGLEGIDISDEFYALCMTKESDNGIPFVDSSLYKISSPVTNDK